MTVRVNQEEFSGRWVLALKAVATLLLLVMPLIVSLQSWLVVESFGTKAELAVVNEKLNVAASHGPKHTQVQSDLADMKQTQEIMTSVKELVQPLLFSINELDKRVDNLQ